MKMNDKAMSRVLMALTAIGLLVSIYMTIYKYTSNEAMCLGSGDCSTVNASRYSEVNGIPVALVGVLGYGALLAVIAFEARIALLQEHAGLLLFGLSLAGFLFTLWLVYVEVALIQALCPFCIASQLAMTLIFLLAIVRLIRETK